MSVTVGAYFIPRPPVGAWVALAACRGLDAELFYPEGGAASVPARAVCARCPVRVECLEHALAAHEPFGIWGGVSARRRGEILHARRHGIAV